MEATIFINERIWWVLGNGDSIFVWRCNWIHSDEGLRKPFSSISTPDLRVKYLWDHEKKWVERLIRSTFSNFRDVESILKIYMSNNYSVDNRVWPFTRNGDLSTKSAFKILTTSNNRNQAASIKWKSFWHVCLPQRVLLFGWKFLIMTIQVRIFLFNKSIDSDASCLIREFHMESIVHVESIEHALIQCNHARATWFGSNLGFCSQNGALKNYCGAWPLTAP